MILCCSQLRFCQPFHLAIFQASVRRTQTHFHLFNIVPNVLLTIIINLAVLIILNSLVHLIDLDVLHYTHLTYTLIPAVDLLHLIQLLTSTGNLIPASLISAVPSRLWDRSVLPDTIYFFLFCFSDTLTF